MPGRDTSFKYGYRYGFNGKEIDNDPYGQGNEYDYGMRIYNPRVGRFLSVDPITRSYPMLTPYQFAENQPIWAVDLDGFEKYVVTKYYNQDKQLKEIAITVLRDKDSKELVNQDLHHEGIKKWQKDVLVRNVFINAPTTYEHFPRLDEEQEKIYKSAKLEVNTEKINPFGVDYGGDGGQTLNSLRGDFTDKKYQIETRVKSYHIISNLQTNKPRQYNDNNNNDNVMAGNLIIRDVENIENDFKSKNSQVSDLKTSVTFTTTPNNLNFVTNITKRLNEMGVKTKIITDKSYKSAPSPNSTPSSQDFKFTTTVTGVLK